MVWKSFCTIHNRGKSLLTAMTHKNASPVHKLSQSQIRLLQLNKMMLALVHLQILARQSAKACEVIRHGIFTQNVIIHEDLKIACETGHSAQTKIGFFADNAMAIWQDFSLFRREERCYFFTIESDELTVDGDQLALAWKLLWVERPVAERSTQKEKSISTC